MVVKHLAVDVTEEEWDILMILRGLVGAKSWNEYIHLFLREPATLTKRLKEGEKRLNEVKEFYDKTKVEETGVRRSN
jgi:hypothetical protein